MRTKIILLLVIIISLFSVAVLIGTCQVHADGDDIPIDDPFKFVL